MMYICNQDLSIVYINYTYILPQFIVTHHILEGSIIEDFQDFYFTSKNIATYDYFL